MRRACLLPFVVVLLASPAAAQPAEIDPATQAARRELITRAQDASEAGDHARAVDLAGRAETIQRSTSLSRFLAHERQQTHDFAGALGAAEECERVARADTTVARRQQMIDDCHALAETLSGEVAHIIVRSPRAPPADLAVRVNGTVLPAALWNVPTIVNPGIARVEASAEGFEPFATNTEAQAGLTAEVVLALEPIAVVAVAAPVVTTVAPPPAHHLVIDRGAPPAGDPGLLGPAIGTAAGVGVFLVVGIALAVVWEDRARTFNVCTLASGLNCGAILDEFSLTQALGITSFVLAGALAATSAVLFVLDLSRPRTGAAMACAPGLAGFACAGRF